jgi:tetratricopeptide (TPR) repeat protein
VCAYRDEDVAGHPRLEEFAGSLRREPHARHLPLSRLRLADTRELLAGVGKSELAERLQRETEGNPFFLMSMLHALEGEISAAAAGELPLPEALRASVRARLAHVPQDARPMLDVAAVLGRRFDFDTLLAVTREPEEKVLTALETLVARRLLREEAEGFYDFSHDKVREVAYREIGGARRMLLHRAVAETLESRGEGEAHLAEHYERGHVRHKALHHMLLAAERSQKLFALRDALHWLDRAVALAEAHGEALQGHALVDLYERRGAVRAQAGQTAGAVEDIRRVIEAANANGERAKARDALIQLGMAYRRADDYVQATACLTRALAECREMKDERHAADTLYHLGTVVWSDCRNAEAIGYHQEAVEICERLALADLVAVQAYHGRGEAHYNSLEPRAAIACFERSNELARAIGDKSYESENLMMIAYANTGYMGLGEYAQSEAKFQAALEIAQRADLQWHMGPTVLGLHHVKACTGRYGEAWKGMTETLRWLESVRHTRYQMIAYDFLTVLLLDLGLNRKAVETGERGLARAKAESVMFWRPRLEANLAIARLRLGDLNVGPALEAALAYCRQYSEHFQAMRCLEGLAELSLARGDHAGCLEIAAQMLGQAEAAGAIEMVAQARRWRGQALLARNDMEGAGRELATAARAAYELGRVRLAYDIECTRDEKAALPIAARMRESVAGTELENRALTPIS